MKPVILKKKQIAAKHSFLMNGRMEEFKNGRKSIASCKKRGGK